LGWPSAKKDMPLRFFALLAFLSERSERAVKKTTNEPPRSPRTRRKAGLGWPSAKKDMPLQFFALFAFLSEAGGEKKQQMNR
jgi:hypothetical protein